MSKNRFGKFWNFDPWRPQFWPEPKMTEMISKWFFASFRTLPFVFLYGDQEPRSWGGAFKRPPPPPAGGGKSRGPAGRGLNFFLKTRKNVPLPIQKACMRTMCTVEARLRVIRQPTNERWARRTLIGWNSAVTNTLFTLAISNQLAINCCLWTLHLLMLAHFLCLTFFSHLEHHCPWNNNFGREATFHVWYFSVSTTLLQLRWIFRYCLKSIGSYIPIASVGHGQVVSTEHPAGVGAARYGFRDVEF